MATFASDSDLLEYVPDIKKYGIQEFTTEHEKTYDDIIRLLNIRWWPTAEYGRYDLSIAGGHTRLTEGRLDPTQFTRAAVYHTLAHYIFPKMTTWNPEGDAFREQINFYKGKFEEEFEFILREGVRYDLDSSGTYEDGEKQSFNSGRLIR